MQYGHIVSIGPQAWQAFKDWDGKAWGPGKKWAAVGEYVLYSKYGGKFVTDPITEEELIIVNDADVLCKVIEE